MTICAILTGGPGKSCVRRVALAALAALCRPVVTAGGDDARRELAGLPVDIIEDETIAGALRVALAAAPHLDAALLLRPDRPSVTASDLSRLFARFRASHCAIVASSYQRTIGLPALFGRSLFPELSDLAAEAGVRRLIAAHSRDLLAVPLPQGGSQIESADEYAIQRER